MVLGRRRLVWIVAEEEERLMAVFCLQGCLQGFRVFGEYTLISGVRDDFWLRIQLVFIDMRMTMAYINY